jgi:hypothetical protein
MGGKSWLADGVILARPLFLTQREDQRGSELRHDQRQGVCDPQLPSGLTSPFPQTRTTTSECFLVPRVAGTNDKRFFLFPASHGHVSNLMRRPPVEKADSRDVTWRSVVHHGCAEDGWLSPPSHSLCPSGGFADTVGWRAPALMPCNVLPHPHRPDRSGRRPGRAPCMPRNDVAAHTDRPWWWCAAATIAASKVPKV